MKKVAKVAGVFLLDPFFQLFDGKELEENEEENNNAN